MKAIAGASGVLGSKIAGDLLSLGEKVRVLVRSDEARAEWESRGAEVCVGDLTSPASLDGLCRDAEVVITTATAAMRGGTAEIEAVDVDGNRNLIEAAKRAGVKRFVFVSASTADQASPIPLFKAKATAEDMLRASGLQWTILAPHAFMEAWIEMMIGVPLRVHLPVWLHGEGRRLHSFVSINDVAAFAVAAARNESAAGRRLVIGGHPVSWREIVEQCQELTDVPIEVRFLPPHSPVPHVGEPFGTTLGAMAEQFEANDVVIESSALYEEFGVTQTPLRTYLVAMLADRRRPFRGQPAIAPQNPKGREVEPHPTSESVDPAESAHEEKRGETPATDHKPHE